MGGLGSGGARPRNYWCRECGETTRPDAKGSRPGPLCTPCDELARRLVAGFAVFLGDGNDSHRTLAAILWRVVYQEAA